MDHAAPVSSAADPVQAHRPGSSGGRRIRATGPLHGESPTEAAAGLPMGPPVATQPLAFAPFLASHGDEGLIDLERDGDTYRLTVTAACCAVDGRALAEATHDAGTPGALLGSVLVAEAAWDAGLPDVAIPGVLQAFRISLATGATPSQALAAIQPRLSLAILVEGYVGSPDGLAHDRARIAHFTPEALAGRIGNSLVVAMQVDPGKQRDLVGAYRDMLDRSLDDVIQAVREARFSGDYDLAADLMARFFQICVDVTAADEWRQRLNQYRRPPV